VQPRLQVWDVSVVHEVDVLILDRALQALDEDVVQGSASAVHADLDARTLQDAGGLDGGEARTLASVEGRRQTSLQRLP